MDLIYKEISDSEAQPLILNRKSERLYKDKKTTIGADIGNSKDYTIISDYKNGILVNERLIRHEEEVNEKKYEA